MIYMGVLKKRKIKAFFLWLLVVGFSLRVSVFTFSFCLLIIKTQSRSIYTQKKRKSSHLDRASLEITYIYVAKRWHFLADTAGYPEPHDRVANHKAGSVSSGNFNAELALQGDPRLHLYNHGVKKTINILKLTVNKQSIKLLHIEANKQYLNFQILAPHCPD